MTRIRAALGALVVALLLVGTLAKPAAATSANDCNWIWQMLDQALDEQGTDLDIIADLNAIMGSPEYDPNGDDAWVEPFYYQIQGDYDFITEYIDTLANWAHEEHCF